MTLSEISNDMELHLISLQQLRFSFRLLGIIKGRAWIKLVYDNLYDGIASTMAVTWCNCHCWSNSIFYMPWNKTSTFAAI